MPLIRGYFYTILMVLKYFALFKKPSWGIRRWLWIKSWAKVHVKKLMWWFRGCRDRGILGVCWPASIDNQFTPASVRDLAPKQVTSGLHMSEYTCMCAFTYVYVHTRGGVRVRAVRFLFLDYKSISLHFLLEVLKLHVLHLGLQTLYKNEFHQHYKLKKICLFLTLGK